MTQPFAPRSTLWIPLWTLGFMTLIFFCLAISVQAAPIQLVAKDFQPITGTVVGTNQDQVLIDLDAADGIEPGDVFTISEPGQKIIHPKTKKVLGTTHSLQAVLIVGQIADGFSFTRSVLKKAQITPGQPVQRFENLRAVFWDYTDENNEPLFQDLREALPHLRWMPFQKAQAVQPNRPEPIEDQPGDMLYFILEPGELLVRGPSFELIETYAVQDLEQSSGTGEVITPQTQPLVPPPSSQTGVEAGVAYQERFSQLETVANLKHPTVMADFLTTEDGLLMASSDGKKLQVAHLSEGMQVIASGQTDYPGQVLSLSWWTPEDTAQTYILANIWSDDRMQSAVFAYTGENLRCVQDRISKLLASFDRTGDQKPETLLAQAYDHNKIFGTRVWEGRLEQDSLDWTPTGFPLPRLFQVTGSSFADVTGDGEMETLCIANNILFIFDGTQALYKSSAPVGGSLSALLYDKNTSVQNRISDRVTFELPPLVRDIDQDGRPEVLVSTFAQDLFGSLTGDTGAKQSQLLVINYQNGRFEHGTLGGIIDGSIQGFTLDNDRAFLVASQKGGVFKGGGTTDILSFPLKK